MTSKDKEVPNLPEPKIPDNKADQVKGGGTAKPGPRPQVRQSSDPRWLLPTGIAGPSAQARIRRMTPRKNRKPPKEENAADEVIRLEDLAPRGNIKGGAKLRFGEATSEETARTLFGRLSFQRRNLSRSATRSESRECPRGSRTTRYQQLNPPSSHARTTSR